MKNTIIILVLAILTPVSRSQTTPMLFPINAIFGGAAIGKPLILTPQNKVIWDGYNFWSDSYQVVPASTTNPVVSLYRGPYLLTIQGVVSAVRFTVPPPTNNQQVVTMVPSSGGIFCFGPKSFANVNAGTNIIITTNGDGSVTISASGGGTAPSGGSGTVTNLASVGSTNVFLTNGLAISGAGNSAVNSTVNYPWFPGFGESFVNVGYDGGQGYGVLGPLNPAFNSYFVPNNYYVCAIAGSWGLFQYYALYNNDGSPGGDGFVPMYGVSGSVTGSWYVSDSGTSPAPTVATNSTEMTVAIPSQYNLTTFSNGMYQTNIVQ